jgi:hypothetical protein
MPFQHLVGLMHDPGRRLGDNFEIRVGHHQRQLDDAIAVGIEALSFPCPARRARSDPVP